MRVAVACRRLEVVSPWGLLRLSGAAVTAAALLSPSLGIAASIGTPLLLLGLLAVKVPEALAG